VTFFEDALRIVTQFNDQVFYLKEIREFPNGVTHAFLISNVVVMTICSILVVARKYSEFAVAGLAATVIAQYIGYGYRLLFGINYFLRTLSVFGGLLMILVDSWVRKPQVMAGLPSIEDKDRKMYFQLAGRVLLIFLFIGFVFNGTWDVLRIIVALFGFVACVMVVVGFKAKFSATMLVALLSIFNVLVNDFWKLREDHWNKDGARYDFFQVLSIVGGLLLLVNNGAGKYSMDEKMKNR